MTRRPSARPATPRAVSCPVGGARCSGGRSRSGGGPLAGRPGGRPGSRRGRARRRRRAGRSRSSISAPGGGAYTAAGRLDLVTQRSRRRSMSETTTQGVETEQAAREASGAHPYGRYLEEFEVGDVYKHWPAKTVTEADDHLFCLLTMNHHPLHLNDVYAAESQQGRNVVVGPLVYSLALGMSVSDVSGK